MASTVPLVPLTLSPADIGSTHVPFQKPNLQFKEFSMTSGLPFKHFHNQEARVKQFKQAQYMQRPSIPTLFEVI